jgi:hypothetical protein
MNKPFSAWDQDELRRAMGESVPPEHRPRLDSRETNYKGVMPGGVPSQCFALMKAGGEYTSPMLQKALGVPLNSISTSLYQLHKNGLVTRERDTDGRTYRYRLAK